MASLNKAMLIGNLGKDPESRFTDSGMEVCNFSVATSEKYKGEEKTEWHNITAFGKLAAICGEYLTKGRTVYIEGRLNTRKWLDRDGSDRWTTGIIAERMVMLSGKGDGGNIRESQADDAADYNDPNEIPF